MDYTTLVYLKIPGQNITIELSRQPQITRIDYYHTRIPRETLGPNIKVKIMLVNHKLVGWISILYEVCLKSNETGVIKTLLKNNEIRSDTKVKLLQSNPLPLENTCAFAFFKIQNILGRYFLGSF